MENLTEKISTALKLFRKQRGWSLDTASQHTGVSKAMLGQIERGESSPTIATLWKIANGFDVSFSSFLEDLTPTNSTLTYRRSNLKQIHPQDNKIRIMPLFAYDEFLGVEIFIIELLPGCEHLSSPHSKEVIEHIIVSSGEVEVLIDNNWHRLIQNEGVRFKANQPHGYRNTTSTKATFHNLIHYKKS